MGEGWSMKFSQESLRGKRILCGGKIFLQPALCMCFGLCAFRLTRQVNAAGQFSSRESKPKYYFLSIIVRLENHMFVCNM